MDKTIQTTRRFEASKLWLNLRTVGADALGNAFDQTIHLSVDAYERVRQRTDIACYQAPALGCLVFRPCQTSFTSAVRY